MPKEAEACYGATGNPKIGEISHHQGNDRNSMAPILDSTVVDMEDTKGQIVQPACSMSTAVEKQILSEDNKDTARKHNTRGQNGIKKRIIELCSPAENQEEADEDLFINSCADALAFIDRRACARLLLEDANSLLHEILLPMSFPWSHRTAPFMRVPRDIEDIPGIVEIGYTDPESDETYGKFELLNDKMLSANTKAAARRSDDPGVIKLTTVYEPSRPKLDAVSPLNCHNSSNFNPAVSGEMSLRMFEEVQARKRAKQVIVQSTTKTQEISIRLGSTSSRYTVLKVTEKGRAPLIIPALLPREVQEGRRRSGANAFEAAQAFGTYNCRQGQIEPPKNSSMRRRAWVGRTRLIWSEPDHGSVSTHRVPFRSILTGERLESNVHKRPLHVKVGVQVGGQLISSFKSVAKKCLAGLDAALLSTDPKLQFSYPSRVVNEALEHAIIDSVDVRDHSRCSLQNEKFFANIMEDSDSECRSMLLSKVLKPWCLKNNCIPDDGIAVNVHPPRLDCTSTEDGIIHVVCTRPGYFEWRQPSAVNVSAKSTERIIVERICSDLKICSICYTAKAEDLNSACASCVHLVSDDLLDDSTVESQRNDETNFHAAKKRRCCTICMLDCGVLVRDVNQDCFVHDICRIWVGSGLDAQSRVYDEGQCHLCSSGSANVVRCAATNCRVNFHPMCAIIMSKASQCQQNFKMSDPREHDAFLCTQFEISMLQTSYRTYSGSRDHTLVPVAFCGYHNPKRQADHFSMYPGCCYLRGAMRIPPRRERKL